MTSQPMADTVAIVLAAGSGHRFGGPGQLKQLEPLEGRPLVVHAVEVARAAGIEQVIVVAGPRADDITHVLAGHDVEVVVNEDHASGQASSLAAGLRAADDVGATLAVVLLADQPGIDPRVVAAVVATAREGGLVARARYEDGPGHPVALPHDQWTWIADRVTGDAGVRQLLGELDVVDVAVTGPAPPDVDTPEDLDTHQPSPES